MEKKSFYDEFFKNDIANHTMQIIRDDGANRHIRFQRPGTMCMHFDLITWPGYLCYTGDMGTFVFRRLRDMFEFFRREIGKNQYRIDYQYWAEKTESADKIGGIEGWTEEAFESDVRMFFENITEDDEEWPEERKKKLWDAIVEDVLNYNCGNEHLAITALQEFTYEGRLFFQDSEIDGKEYSHRFLWCCHALVWAIDKYDDTSKPEREEVNR